MRQREFLPAAVLILLLATFLRFHLLGAQSFWNDEGNSARLSERPIAAIIEGTASDVHPPFYYLLLRGWRELAGETEFGLRALSAFAGVLTVAVVVALGSRGAEEIGRPGDWETDPLTTGHWPLTPDHWPLTTIIAALLAAVSPALVYYSQETRMYSLLALLASASTWALLNWLGAGRPWRWAAAYTGLLAAGLYTHYFFPAVVAAHGLVVALWWLRARADIEGAWRRVAAWAGLAAVAVALYGPWLPVVARQIGGRGSGDSGVVGFLADAARWLVLGGTMPVGAGAWVVLAAMGLVIFGVASGWRKDEGGRMKDDGRGGAVAMGLMVVVPVGVAAVLGATDPAFFKFLLVAAPFVAVLAGKAWEERDEGGRMKDEGGRKKGEWGDLARLVVVGGLTVIVLAGSLVSLGHMYLDPAFARADYRAMAARIAAEGHPNAGIVLVAPNQWEAFTYYHREGAPVYPLPRGRPDPAALAAELEGIAAAHDRIYALFWGEAQRDPERVVERWLDAHTFKAAEEWVGDVRFVVYAVARETTAEPVPSGARFAGLDGETMTLHEYTVWPAAARPGDVVQVRLVWSSDATPSRPYKVFIHLLGDEGLPVAQRDGEPGGGSRPATSWAAGETIEDNHGVLLPPDLLPGTYDLRVGLYDAFDPTARLVVEDGDSLLLGSVTIEE